MSSAVQLFYEKPFSNFVDNNQHLEFVFESFSQLNWSFWIYFSCSINHIV